MKSFLVFLALFALVCAAPLEQQPGEIDPELTAGYYEGDMVLDELQGRNGLINTNRRWPNNIVYYNFAAGYFDNARKNHIVRGMRIIEGVSCIRFQEATANDQYYITITGDEDGCYSNVGYLQRAGQICNLQVAPVGTGCFRLGTVVHELLHTLGFVHMQCDSNRDDYVHIATENIQTGKESNFNKYSATIVTDYGQEYDYGSVLHYGPYAFSKNGEKTIVALQDIADGVMGQRAGMSEKDIIKLNAMYCLATTTTEATTTTAEATTTTTEATTTTTEATTTTTEATTTTTEATTTTTEATTTTTEATTTTTEATTTTDATTITEDTTLQGLKAVIGTS